MAVEISVVIPCYDHAYELEGCLHGLQDQQADLEFEVIVVDSSPDEGIGELTGGFPNIHFIQSKNRLFGSEARNLGVKHAKAPYLAFMDADCIPSKNWVQQAKYMLSSGHKIVGGPILDVTPIQPVAWVDNRLQFADFQAGRRKERGDHFPSCNLVMHREVFERVGGFKGRHLSAEDYLFSIDARRDFSDHMWFDPDLIVFHLGRNTLRSMLSHQHSLGYHRGLLKLAFTRAWQLFARSPVFGGLAVLRRLGYVCLRTLQYDRPGFFRLICYSPLFIMGLIAWTTGFYHGVAEGKNR